MSGPVEIELGFGKLGLRMGGKHLVLTRGKKNRAKMLRVPEKYIGIEVRLVAVIKSKSEERAR